MDPSYDIDQIAFRLSFHPFVDFLNDQRNKASSSALGALYSYLIDQLAPGISSDMPADLLPTDRLKDLFELATIATLPLSGSSQRIPFAFGLPEPLTIYYQSTAFSQLIQQFPNLLAELPAQAKALNKHRFVYQLILEKIYGVQITNPAFPVFRFQLDVNGLTRYYQIDVNVSFMDVKASKEIPPLKHAWIDFANGIRKTLMTIDSLALNGFVFEGFSFFKVEDITEAETIQQLQAVFAHLQSDTEAAIYQRFEKALRNLCGQPDLQISIVPLPQVNGLFVDHTDLRRRSVFLRHSSINFQSHVGDTTTQQRLRSFAQRSIPYLFPDLDDLPESERQLLNQKGTRSFLMYPITTASEVLGILEMGSKHPNALNEDILTKIERIMPLLQELLRYQLRQFQDTLEGLIKKQFTRYSPPSNGSFMKLPGSRYGWGKTNQ